MKEYNALKAAREMATKDVAANLRRISAKIAPEGFSLIVSAPKDGTFIRLRFRPGLGRENWEIVGQWKPIADMPAGGWWFDRDGTYVSPGPLFWAPEHGQIS